jgi:RHS repeat-associated protein
VVCSPEYRPEKLRAERQELRAERAGEVDPLGNLTASRKYDVYGRAGDSGTSRHRFVGSLGHTSDDETGLIYMRARWMDPSLGRFISEDPARDGSNWLECSRGNPVNAVDPDGREYTLANALQSAALFGMMSGFGDLAYQAVYSWLRTGSVSVDWGEVAAWTVAGAACGGVASASAILGSFLGTFSWAEFGKLHGAAAGLGVMTGGTAGALNALRFRDAQVRVTILLLFDGDCGPERQLWD